MRRFFSAGALAASFLVAPAFAKETIEVLADQWCPVSCEPTSTTPGYMIDILQEAFPEPTFEVRYRTASWSRALAEVRSGRSQAVVGAMRGDAPDFVFPKQEEGLSETCFYTGQNSEWGYHGIQSLNSIRIGVSKGYSYSADIDAYIKSNTDNLKKIDFVTGDNPLESSLSKIDAKRIDAFLEDSFVIRYRSHSHEIKTQLRNAGCIELKPLYVAFSPKLKNSDLLAKRLSNKMQDLKKSGKLSAIMKRYGL